MKPQVVACCDVEPLLSERYSVPQSRNVWAWVLKVGQRRVTVWTRPPTEPPALLGVEVSPWPPHWDRKSAQSWLEQRCIAEDQTYSVATPPLLASEIRGLPFAEIQTAIAATPEAENLRAEAEHYEQILADLDDREAWRYLRDARVYARAIARGENGGDAVAEDRGIAKSTALARIAKARRLDLLTATKQRMAGGTLTGKARFLISYEESSQGDPPPEATDPERKAHPDA